MKKKCKKVVILFGPPGSGKGTQADLLSENLNFFHFETSKIIRGKFQKGDPDPNVDIEYEKNLYYSGQLNTPRIVAKWVREKVWELYKEGKGIVFDGSPRTLEEAEKINALIKETYGVGETVCFYINVLEEEIKERLSNRLICEKCKKTVSSVLHNISSCPKCGGKLIKRDLDDPKIMPTRLAEYYERTYPTVLYFKNGKEIDFYEINGSRSISEVQSDIRSKILKC